ncbi:MAG: TOBE domain-containing protein [Candidatus Bathyarchaeota archaeon]|nr:MAG: TOBE domain-containing protein [Candidatus Bathyarchaeota archaeon]
MAEEQDIITKPVVKLWLETEKGYVFGEGAFELLGKIEKYGTISKAATSMNMSYRQAWGILKKVEKRLGEPLVETKRGGAYGGGRSTLTPLGRRILQQYCVEKEIIQIKRDDDLRWEDLSRKLSTRNQLDAEVISVENRDVTSIVKVRISAPTLVTAVITREAAEELSLKKGTRVQASMKATSVMIDRNEE